MLFKFNLFKFLLKAARNGRTDACKVLIKKGCNINTMNKDGNTPLITGWCLKTMNIIVYLFI